MPTLLSIRNMTKRFGGLVAVNNLSLDVEELSIVSLIGPNGAGKTTVFNCITGFYSPEEGSILFQGHPIQGRSPDRVTAQGIARTYQNIRLFANMTAIENILVGQHPLLKTGWLEAILHPPRYHSEEKQALEEALRLLDFVELSKQGDNLASSLAYAAQRKLEIARALASKPKIILLDEPTAGMSPKETADATRFIKRLRDELGITVLLIEHDMHVVMGISENITVLDYGSKIAEGQAKQIQTNPLVIEAYLGRGAASGQDQVKTTRAATSRTKAKPKG
ncbi:MAG TPA: ABC transporter ATP-binding protein [Anaerolineales bacterium]